jgi:hypothetical protein
LADGAMLLNHRDRVREHAYLAAVTIIGFV